MSIGNPFPAFLTGDRSLEQWALVLDIPEDSLRSYNAGRRMPKPAIAARIADKLFPEEDQTEAKAAFLTNVETLRQQRRAAGVAARKLKRPVGPTSDAPVPITSINYGPICHANKWKEQIERRTRHLRTGSGFIDGLVQRVLDFEGSGARVQISIRESSRNVREELRNGTSLLAAPYLASVDRLRDVKFWLTPIQIALGAAVLSDDWKLIPAIQEALAHGQSASSAHQFTAVTLPDSVGRSHSEQLGIPAETVDARDPEQYVSKMTELRNAGKIPVFIDDELTVIEFVKDYQPDHRSKGPFVVPALPLSTRFTIGKNKARLLSPVYFVAVGCSRKDERTVQRLTEAFSLYYLSEINTTAQAYVALYDQLLQILRDGVKAYDLPIESRDGFGMYPITSDDDDERMKPIKRERVARAWVNRALQLRKASIESFTLIEPSWKPILGKAREEIRRSLAEEADKLIENLIDLHMTDYQSPGFPEKNQLRQILDFFDVDIDLENPHILRFLSADRQSLVDGIRNSLRGDPADTIRPDLKLSDMEKDDNYRKDLFLLLHDLRSVYGWRKISRADDDIANLMRDESSRDGVKFVIAYLPGRAKPVGCVCFTPYAGGLPESPDTHASEEADERKILEFKYLWVVPRYRELGLGRRILSQVKSYAIATGYSHLIAQVPKEMEGLRYLGELGFLPAPNYPVPPEYENRSMFLMKVADD